jgi:hypothetical protein
MGIRGNHAEEGLDRTGQGPLLPELRGEVLKLFPGRERAEQEKMGHLLEGGLFRQVLDGVPPVPEPGPRFINLAER